jgi:hypothetical protein
MGGSLMRGLRTITRIAALLILALPAGAAAQAPAQPAGSPALIVVPGLGVGQWTVDGKLSDYIFAMGETQVEDPRPSGTDLPFRTQLDERSYKWPRLFLVYVPTSNAVLAVGTSEPAAQTIERVGIGSTEEQLVAAYGDPQLILQLPLRSRTLVYDDRGIAFEMPFVPATGQFSPAVGRLFVFRPGQARTIWRFP